MPRITSSSCSCQNNTEKTKSIAHGLIYGQRTKELQDSVQSKKRGWKTVQKNPFEIKKALREATHKYQNSRCAIGTVATSIRTLLNMKQEKGESLVEYANRFKNTKDIMET